MSVNIYALALRPHPHPYRQYQWWGLLAKAWQAACRPHGDIDYFYSVNWQSLFGWCNEDRWFWSLPYSAWRRGGGKGIKPQMRRTHSIAPPTFALPPNLFFSHHISPGAFVHTSQLFHTPPSLTSSTTAANFLRKELVPSLSWFSCCRDPLILVSAILPSSVSVSWGKLFNRFE